MKRLLTVCVLALAVAGCGGDDDNDEPAQSQVTTVTETQTTAPPPTEAGPAPGDDERQVKEVWRQYTAALGEGDGEAACALLTENGQDDLVSESRAAGSTCEEVVEEIGPFFKGFDTELTDVKVQGDAAEAVSPARGQVRMQAVGLSRVDGEWKIDRTDEIK